MNNNDPSTPKENANPTVHDVATTTTTSRTTRKNHRANILRIQRALVGVGGGGGAGDEAAVAATGSSSLAVDRAVAHALQDAHLATNGKGVSLLRNVVGLTDLFPTVDNNNDEPVSVSVAPSRQKDEIKKMQKHHLRRTAFFPIQFHNSDTAQEEGGKKTSNNKESDNKKLYDYGTTKQQQQQNKKKPSSGQQQQQQHRDEIDVDEIFDLIRNIQDPEHPLTLQQLGVVSREQIDIISSSTCATGSSSSSTKMIDIRFTPTIPHCSMATLIGLCIRVKLWRSLSSSNSPSYKVKVHIEPGTHDSENSVNKQLEDKERVCAALENPHLLGVVNKCISAGMQQQQQQQ